jgi:hypothetical protein
MTPAGRGGRIPAGVARKDGRLPFRRPRARVTAPGGSAPGSWVPRPPRCRNLPEHASTRPECERPVRMARSKIDGSDAAEPGGALVSAAGGGARPTCRGGRHCRAASGPGGIRHRGRCPGQRGCRKPRRRHGSTRVRASTAWSRSSTRPSAATQGCRRSARAGSGAAGGRASQAHHPVHPSHPLPGWASILQALLAVRRGPYSPPERASVLRMVLGAAAGPLVAWLYRRSQRPPPGPKPPSSPYPIP